MADIFLSYKREDQAAARDVAADLEAEGFSVFFDVRIPVGDSWDSVIERELEAAHAVVVLWSPDARESPWVKREAREGMARGALCPAVIVSCKPPLEFSDIQAASLIGRAPGDRAQPEWRRLVEAAHRCVGRVRPAVRSEEAAPTLGGGSRGGALAWSRIEASLDIRLYDIFLDENPGAPERAVARLHKLQLEDWSKVDKSDPDAIAAHLRDAGHPLFAALADMSERTLNRVRHEIGEAAWKAVDKTSRKAVAAFIAAHSGHARIEEAETARNHAPRRIERVVQIATLSGHSGAVYRAVVSPDGTRIVTTSGHIARLWDAQTGAILATLSGHSGDVSSPAFSPDGLRIATASADMTARIWDARAGTSLVTLSGHSGHLNGVAFSPDGSRIVTASIDMTGRLWDARSGASLATLSGHSGFLLCAAFSPDGQRVVTTSADKTARIWDAQSGASLATLSGHSSFVLRAVFSPDGTCIVTASYDETARLWDTRTGASFATLSGHSGIVNYVAFSPDGQRIVTASVDKTARLWDARSGTNVVTLLGHSNSVTSATFSPDGTRIVTASDDKTARIWDAQSGASLATLSGHSEMISGAAFSPDGLRIVTASVDKTARIWRIVEED